MIGVILSCAVSVDWTAVSAIATAVMAVMTYFSIRSNNKNNRKQFEQSEKQLEELREQVRQSESQLRELREQGVDNRFQILLNSFKEARSMVSCISFNSDDNKNVFGIDAFKAAYKGYCYGRCSNDFSNFFDVSDFLFNATVYYDSLLHILDFLNLNGNSAYYCNLVCDCLSEHEKDWLRIFCKYCTTKLYKDVDALKSRLAVLNFC